MKRMIGIGLAASAAILAVVPFASGHATVSLLQPQGKALTAARVAYVVRAPNEKAKQDTIHAHDVRAGGGAGVDLRQADARLDGRAEAARHGPGRRRGQPSFAIERVTWIAKKGMRIQPGFYGEWSFRMQNPAAPQRLCFAIDQWYSKKTADGKPEAGQVERRRRTAPRPLRASTW